MDFRGLYKSRRLPVIDLDPPPLVIDRRIENLKRLEIRFPCWAIGADSLQLHVLPGDAIP
jgi:hypothetical protein